MKVAVPSLSNGPKRHHRWKITSQIRYVLIECRAALRELCYVPTLNRHIATYLYSHFIELNILIIPLVGDERVYVQFPCERDQCIQLTT
jgi:hypothetical protein